MTPTRLITNKKQQPVGAQVANPKNCGKTFQQSPWQSRSPSDVKSPVTHSLLLHCVVNTAALSRLLLTTHSGASFHNSCLLHVRCNKSWMSLLPVDSFFGLAIGQLQKLQDCKGAAQHQS